MEPTGWWPSRRWCRPATSSRTTSSPPASRQPTGRRRAPTRPASPGEVASMYDVIVVGARVAGASTAMLLAQRGLKVLCIDKTTFPSDTLSTHQIQLPGVAKLKQWGLLEQVAANTPPTREVRFDTGEVVLEGRFPLFEGVDAIYGPRRIFLDKILVDAARASGVELREDVVVEGLVSADGRVTGVRGRSTGGAPVVETAALVVGADGKR